VIKFTLADRKIRFVTHTVSWEETCKQLDTQTNLLEEFITAETRECYSEEQKDTLISKLSERNISAEVTEEEKPSVEMLEKCEGKRFKNYNDAKFFIETGKLPLTEADILALAITEIYEMISGGAS
jgi:CelD/BcsL family acetyltransferase involved in cellulose biosynthesis